MFNSRKPSQFGPLSSDFEGQSKRELGKQQGVLQGVKGLREKRGERGMPSQGGHGKAGCRRGKQEAFPASPWAWLEGSAAGLGRTWPAQPGWPASLASSPVGLCQAALMSPVACLVFLLERIGGS